MAANHACAGTLPTRLPSQARKKSQSTVMPATD